MIVDVLCGLFPPVVVRLPFGFGATMFTTIFSGSFLLLLSLPCFAEFVQIDDLCTHAAPSCFCAVKSNSNVRSQVRKPGFGRYAESKGRIAVNTSSNIGTVNRPVFVL